MKYIENGNIFDSNCDVICNPVNIVSVMGKGLALEFKNKYPEMFKEYKRLCSENLLKTGEPVILFKTELIERNIILFPTKEHWKDKSKIEYIENGLSYLGLMLDRNKINSIAFPLLGAGLGGLNKEDVIKLIEDFETKYQFNCELYLR